MLFFGRRRGDPRKDFVSVEAPDGEDFFDHMP
jgi:hypothetical protein